MTKTNAVGPEFLWPYPLIWFADHWIRDYQEFIGRLSTANTPQDIVRAETSLGQRCARDTITAWSDLCLIPLTVVTAAVSTAGKPT